MTRKQHADALIEETATRLRNMLHEAATQLHPFPPFPGAFFTNAIEVEAAEADTGDRGCIVVCGDGELYELKININFDEDQSDPVQARDETLTKLDDLHPRDYIALASEALTRITEELMEREGG